MSSSRYRELLAIDDVSFTVHAGEFIGITGPNGCGKSTLLKMLSRIYTPDAGRIATIGRISPFLELGVGFKGDLTARENVVLGGTILGRTKAQLTPRVADVLEFAELGAFADQKLKNFSSGMVVRLAFAVAMLADASILLLDEVLAVGDARFQEKCLDVFGEYKQEGRTVVLVSHDLATLEAYCDRVLLLNEGRLVADGPPAETIGKYRRLVAELDEANGSQSGRLDGEPTRWGTREAEIAGIEVTGAEGAARQSFFTGEALRIVVKYVSTSLEGPVNCALQIRRSDGSFLAGPHSRGMDGSPWAVLPGECGEIVYEIPVLQLLGGRYRLSAGLFDESLRHAYDFLLDAVSFQVHDEAGHIGVVELGGSWR